ncbi:MAG: amidohydrolase, partial [Acidimicrobiia bacterium]|nr:amidohydrolase [Acidimicrobiia bacterium]
EQIGSDIIVWASDYPHWDSEFPTSVTGVTGRPDLDDHTKQAIFEVNPKRLFGWD